MSIIDIAKNAEKLYGQTLDLFRYFVPRSLLLHWIAEETGWERFAVSSDKRLIEVGWSQVPIITAYKLNTDPFHSTGALWLAGTECLRDASYWRAENAKETDKYYEIRKDVSKWLTENDRNLWWVIEEDYSIGTFSLRHVLHCALKRAEAAGRTPKDRGLMNESIDWAEHTDLSLPIHKQYWGRQEPEKILMRLKKHKDWIEEAEMIGPIDDAPYGEQPIMTRPQYIPAFPREIIQSAKTVNNPDATTEQCTVAWKAVKAYVKERKAKENTPSAPLTYRVQKMFSRTDRTEIVERDNVA